MDVILGHSRSHGSPGSIRNECYSLLEAVLLYGDEGAQDAILMALRSVLAKVTDEVRAAHKMRLGPPAVQLIRGGNLPLAER